MVMKRSTVSIRELNSMSQDSLCSSFHARHTRCVLQVTINEFPLQDLKYHKNKDILDNRLESKAHNKYIKRKTQMV